MPNLNNKQNQGHSQDNIQEGQNPQQQGDHQPDIREEPEEPWKTNPTEALLFKISREEHSTNPSSQPEEPKASTSSQPDNLFTLKLPHPWEENTNTSSQREEPKASIRKLPLPDDEYRHRMMVRYEKMRRCQYLELRAAKQGIITDPSVLTEIEDLRAELKQFEKELSLLPERHHILTTEEQRAILETLAAMGCEFVDRIRLINIVIGSVILIVEMPLAGAARLMALQQVNHPQLEREGIINIEFDRERNALRKSQLSDLVTAVNFEIQDLQGEVDKISKESPFTTRVETVPLRVTIDPDKIKIGKTS